MTDVRLELPFPPKELSPNSRPNRWEKARAVREYREACGWLAKLVKSPSHASDIGRYPLQAPVTAAVTFVVPTRHKRDLDNLLAMLKPAWDGLTDAGVLAGDDSERFSVESAEVVVRHDHALFYHGDFKPCVIVELRSL